MTRAQRLALSRIKNRSNHVWVRKTEEELVEVRMTEAVNRLFYRQAKPELEHLNQ